MNGQCQQFSWVSPAHRVGPRATRQQPEPEVDPGHYEESCSDTKEELFVEVFEYLRTCFLNVDIE